MKFSIFNFLIYLNFLEFIYNQNKKEDIPPETLEEDKINKKNDKDLIDSFSKEWAKRMSDYESDYVYMIPVRYKEPEIFYENITDVPCKIKGAFILDVARGDKIEFKIISPSKKEIYKNFSAASIFELEVKEPGPYAIVFYNNSTNREVKPTFTMNNGQNSIVHSDDLNKTEDNLDILSNCLKNYMTSNKMKGNILRERAKKLKKNNQYFYTFSIIESIVLIVVSMWQFYYMKHLFEIKGAL